MTASTTHSLTTTDARRPRRAFLRHLGEMIAAMVVGMVVLGGAIEGVLALLGAGSMGDAPPAIAATVMAFNMTAPMVWWMRFRGHPSRHSAEMAGSMIVPTAAVIALYWAGAIGAHGVLMAQHVVMIPAMVAVMLYRYEHYSR